MQTPNGARPSPEKSIVDTLPGDASDLRSIVEAVDAEPLPDPFLGFGALTAIEPCEEGLILLRKFADASPALYELAERANFIDMRHPGFKTNPLWLAFQTHYSSCGNCNED